MNRLEEYISQNGGKITMDMAYAISSLSILEAHSTLAAESVVKELRDQRQNLKLIASENYSSLSVQAAMGSLLTDKYSEGFPGHRFYAGCDNVDVIESAAVEKAKKIFGADHAYVQPHSGADANLCAYWAILNQRVQIPMLEEMGVKNPSDLSREDWNKIREATHNQKLLGLDYYSGGHLTHGYRQNISAQLFDAYSYSVDKETGLLDYKEIERLAKEIKPLILLDWFFHKVSCFYPTFTRECNGACSVFGMIRIVFNFKFFGFVFRIICNYKLYWVQYTHNTVGTVVKVITQTMFQKAVFNN